MPDNIDENFKNLSAITMKNISGSDSVIGGKFRFRCGGMFMENTMRSKQKIIVVKHIVLLVFFVFSFYVCFSVAADVGEEIKMLDHCSGGAGCPSDDRRLIYEIDQGISPVKDAEPFVSNLGNASRYPEEVTLNEQIHRFKIHSLGTVYMRIGWNGADTIPFAIITVMGCGDMNRKIVSLLIKKLMLI